MRAENGGCREGCREEREGLKEGEEEEEEAEDIGMIKEDGCNGGGGGCRPFLWLVSKV